MGPGELRAILYQHAKQMRREVPALVMAARGRAVSSGPVEFRQRNSALFEINDLTGENASRLDSRCTGGAECQYAGGALTSDWRTSAAQWYALSTPSTATLKSGGELGLR